MPSAADQLYRREGAPRVAGWPVLATVAFSALGHAAALASVLGFAGVGNESRPAPIEVIFIATPTAFKALDARDLPLATATRAPAPERAIAARPAQPAERAPRPTFSAPVRNHATPAAAAGPLPSPTPPTVIEASIADRPAPVVPPDPLPLVADTRPADPAPIREMQTALQMAPPVPRARPAFEEPTGGDAPNSEPPAEAAVELAAESAAGTPIESPAVASAAPLTAPAEEHDSAAAGSKGATSPPDFSIGSLSNPAPLYPRRARQRGWQGRVVLRVAIDAHGAPVEVSVERSSGHRLLDEVAHRTVTGWVFRPATRNGRSVPGEAVVPVVFRLN